MFNVQLLFFLVIVIMHAIVNQNGSVGWKRSAFNRLVLFVRGKSIIIAL